MTVVGTSTVKFKWPVNPLEPLNLYLYAWSYDYNGTYDGYIANTLNSPPLFTYDPPTIVSITPSVNHFAQQSCIRGEDGGVMVPIDAPKVPTLITITGTNFGSDRKAANGVVYFGFAVCNVSVNANGEMWSHTQIVCRIPSASAALIPSVLPTLQDFTNPVHPPTGFENVTNNAMVRRNLTGMAASIRVLSRTFLSPAHNESRFFYVNGSDPIMNTPLSVTPVCIKRPLLFSDATPSSATSTAVLTNSQPAAVVRLATHPPGASRRLLETSDSVVFDELADKQNQFSSSSAGQFSSSSGVFNEFVDPDLVREVFCSAITNCSKVLNETQQRINGVLTVVDTPFVLCRKSFVNCSNLAFSEDAYFRLHPPPPTVALDTEPYGTYSNGWIHVAVTWDAYEGDIGVYVNGNLINQTQSLWPLFA